MEKDEPGDRAFTDVFNACCGKVPCSFKKIPVLPAKILQYGPGNRAAELLAMVLDKLSKFQPAPRRRSKGSGALKLDNRQGTRRSGSLFGGGLP
jgi:hypothetical protein